MDELRVPAPGEPAPEGLLGDIVLAPEVTAKQAAENHRKPEDEEDYLLVHGLLHLLGYDHAEEADAKLMFALNDRLFAEWKRR
jgi:probable rRNA maturation factor